MDRLLGQIVCPVDRDPAEIVANIIGDIEPEQVRPLLENLGRIIAAGGPPLTPRDIAEALPFVTPSIAESVAGLLSGTVPEASTEVDANGQTQPDAWSISEEVALMVAVQSRGGRSWRSVADAVGTGRSADQCSQHWLRVLCPDIVKGAWSVEEDANLLRLVALHGEGHWRDISRDLPGRTGSQARYRYRRLSMHSRPGGTPVGAPFDESVRAPPPAESSK